MQGYCLAPSRNEMNEKYMMGERWIFSVFCGSGNSKLNKLNTRARNAFGNESFSSGKWKIISRHFYMEVLISLNENHGDDLLSMEAHSEVLGSQWQTEWQTDQNRVSQTHTNTHTSTHIYTHTQTHKDIHMRLHTPELDWDIKEGRKEGMLDERKETIATVARRELFQDKVT